MIRKVDTHCLQTPLQEALQRGFHRHVLGHVVHALLRGLVDPLRKVNLTESLLIYL